MLNGAAALAVGNVVGAALGFAIAVLIGRVTGETGLGVYAAAAAWIFPVGLLVDAGVSAPLTREAAAYPLRAGSLLRAALRARLVMGGAAMFALFALAPVLTGTPQAADALRWGAPLVLLNPAVSAYTAVFRARRQMRHAALLNVGMLGGQTALTALALLAGWGVVGAVIANVVSSAGQLAAAHLTYRRDNLPTDSATVNPWPMVRAAWPFALAAVLAALQMRMGTALSEIWAGAAAAGLYAAAYRFIEAARLIPQAGFDALLPTLSALRDQPDAFARQARQMGIRVALYGVAFGVGCWLLADWFVPLAFGADFAPAGDLLRGMGVALLPMSLKYWAGVAWIARGHERRVTQLNAVGLAAQFIYSALLIPAYGASGAAFALVLGETTGAALLLWGKPQTPR